jgi:hypothetical protein
VLPIDLESGQLGEPAALGYADLGGRTLEACTDTSDGWVFDTSLPGASVRLRLPQGLGAMHGAYARVRLTSSRGCIERIAGMYGQAHQLTRQGARSPSIAKPGEIIATPTSAQTRYALKCTVD